MQSLLEGKRVFREDGDEQRYLLLDTQKVEVFSDLYGVIAVKQGDLLSPQKWHVFGTSNFLSYAVRKNKFNLNDYQIVFYPEDTVGAKLTELLSDYGIQVEIDWGTNNFSEISSLPSKMYDDILRVLEEQRVTSPSDALAYTYFDGEEEKYLLLEEKDFCTDYDGEYTEQFLNFEVVDEYKHEDLTLYSIKGSSRYETRWFLHVPEKPYGYFKEIHEIEDMIPFTNFKKNSPVSL
jgi:hypothetical protein